MYREAEGVWVLPGELEQEKDCSTLELLEGGNAHPGPGPGGGHEDSVSAG